MVKSNDQVISVANSHEELVQLLSDVEVFNEGEGKIEVKFLKQKCSSKYKVIRTGNNGRRDSQRHDVYIDLTNCIGKGGFATVYRGYFVKLDFTNEGMRHVLSTKPIVVRKIKTVDLEKQSGKKNAQYFGLICEVVGKGKEKEFTYQIMEQHGSVDLSFCLSAEQAAKETFTEEIQQYMENCGCLGVSPLLRHQVKGTPAEAFLELGKQVKALGLSDRTHLACELVKALHSLHTGGKNIPGFLHLDLTPGNVMVSFGPKSSIGSKITAVDLIDLESAVLLENVEDTVKISPRSSTGTPLYVSPEMIFPKRNNTPYFSSSCLELSTATDFYSLAPIMAQLFWGNFDSIFQHRLSIDDSDHQDEATKQSNRDLVLKGYDFSTVLPEGTIDEQWRESIRTLIVEKLEKLQNRCPSLRPDYDELKDFLAKLYDLSLAIETNADKAKIEEKLNAFKSSSTVRSGPHI